MLFKNVNNYNDIISNFEFMGSEYIYYKITVIDVEAMFSIVVC